MRNENQCHRKELSMTVCSHTGEFGVPARAAGCLSGVMVAVR